jgi:hypothetical protein
VKWVTALSVSSANSNVLYAGETGFAISEDGGQTWENSNNGLGTTYIELILNPTDDKTIYAHFLRNLGDDRVWDCLSIKERGGPRLETIQWWFHERFNMGGWTSLSGGNFFISMDGIMYKAIDWSIFHSQDNGATWAEFHRVTVWAPQIVNHPQNPSAVYSLAPDFMEFSLDNGKTWINPNLSVGGGINPRLYFTRDSNVIYAASSEKVAKSSDMGAHWQFCPVTAFAPFSDSETKFSVSLMDSNKVFLATDGQGVIVSEDGCVSWHKSNVGLKNLNVNTLSVDSLDPDTICAGTEDGAYVSFNGGQTWVQINNGLLGATVVYSIVVDKDSNVYAATPLGFSSWKASE